METLKCHCEDCGMKYEISYYEQEFIEPEFCAGCGSDNNLTILEEDDED